MSCPCNMVPHEIMPISGSLGLSGLSDLYKKLYSTGCSMSRVVSVQSMMYAEVFTAHLICMPVSCTVSSWSDPLGMAAHGV